jgi:predicted transcriptional regulator
VLRLVSDYPNSTTWYVEDGSKRTRLNDFCRQAREAAGMSMGHLGTQSGLSHPAVSQYENGNGSAIRSMLVALDTLGFVVELHESTDVRT